MSEERREHPRIQAATLVNYAQFNAMRVLKSLETGTTLDVSAGGMKLYGATSIPVTTILDLEFSVGDEVISAVGRVVFNEEESEDRYAMGVRFVDMSDEDRAILDRYLESKAEEDPDEAEIETVEPGEESDEV